MVDARAPVARVAFGACAARILATARVADRQPVRRRPFPGGSGGRASVQPGAGRGTVGDRRLIRGAVPAVLGARPVRGRAAGPLGSPAGARRRKPRQAAAGARCRRPVGRRYERSADPVRRVDRQRFHPIRLVGSVGGAAGRGAPGAGGHDELGGHGHRRSGGVPRRQLHAACRAGCSAPTTPVLPQSFSSSRCRSRSRCCCRCASRRTSSGPTKASERFTARSPTRWPPGGCTARAPCWPCRRSRPRCRGWPRIGWCSASTRCWCW